MNQAESSYLLFLKEPIVEDKKWTEHERINLPSGRIARWLTEFVLGVGTDDKNSATIELETIEERLQFGGIGDGDFGLVY